MGDSMKKIYGYARVSTKEQNLDRQLIALKAFGVDDRDIIREKSSGKSLDRDAYQTLRNQLLREGDTLVITALDRLSRNKLHIKQELEYYRSRGIRVMILEWILNCCTTTFHGIILPRYGASPAKLHLLRHSGSYGS